MKKKRIKLKNTPQVKKYNEVLKRYAKIKKIYGKDFGTDDLEKVTRYLSDKGYNDLADLIYLDYDKNNVWHVYPTNDSAKHRLKGNFCECNPTLEIQPNKALLIVHKAFDGRHLKEK